MLSGTRQLAPVSGARNKRRKQAPENGHQLKMHQLYRQTYRQTDRQFIVATARFAV